MNPNIPYGHMPMQPQQRRHDIPYSQLPQHMRPHPAYQQYYPPPMGPVMPQYQQYPQNWYHYQNHVPPHHNGRHSYYPQHQPVYQPHQIPQQHPQTHQQQQQHQQHPQQQQHQMHQAQQSPIIVSSQPHSHASPRHIHQSPYSQPHALSISSTATVPQIQTPPPIQTAATVDVEMMKNHVVPITPVVAKDDPGQFEPVESHQPREPFSPPVPWLSVQDQPFPHRAPRRRRRVLRSSLGTEPVTFPLVEEIEVLRSERANAIAIPDTVSMTNERPSLTPTQTSAMLPSDTLTRDQLSTQITNTSSAVTSEKTSMQADGASNKPAKSALPIVPIVPFVAAGSNSSQPHRESTVSIDSKPEPIIIDGDAQSPPTTEVDTAINEQDQSSVLPPPPPPSSWAALLRSKTAADVSSAGNNRPSNVANGLGVPKNESLGDVLNEININEEPSKLSFLQPRGLVNTGNMCYMNSVLQMLVFCIPFYEFLDKVAKRASYTFKSHTPLIDAMIMFMREYPPIDSAPSIDQLRLRLKAEDHERYGEPFIPEYVYNVIKQLPRFRDMRRGHQQDAQEFLGFLLEELHEECANAMRLGTASSSGRSTPIGSGSNLSEAADNEDGWMEVGHKQKAAVTRSSGAITTESPVTSIFGGKLRSELKVAGNKLSVTLEPYQPLQLDIGSPQVSNILDALKGLTRPESMQGDFQSARGLKNSATKQVFIETLPPVLILHLKRFHYDATTKRVEKIWKKVGYPLDLEMPKEVFPTSTRNRYAAHGGLPKYRLIGVIYHHGKNASGGHYTVDIRRQDGREWIRVDDTLIRRVRSEDVAEGGGEEDPKVLAAALEQHSQGKDSGNRFEQIEDGEGETSGPEKVWSQVNGHSRSKSAMTALLNGASTPTQDVSGNQTPRDRFSVKDNKVAYLLFYQRV